MSPEPFVSCAQAPPAKGRDGLWGREWQCVMRSRTGTSAPSALPVRFQGDKIFLSTNRKSHFLSLIISQECVMIKQLFNSLTFQLNVFTCVEVLADLCCRKLLKFDFNLKVSNVCFHR